ncbi:MAG TPA: Fic family protein [Solirubrobacterales bacterium]
MPTPWNEDPQGSEQQILANVAAVLRQIAAAAGDRDEPSVAAAQDWHRRIYARVTLPVPYYAGEPRDSDPACPQLQGYEVEIGGLLGTPSAQVPGALADFEVGARRAVAPLDQAISVGSRPRQGQELSAVISLCAVLHGEWVRIHPFANGSGRTARLWANWAALRYGLPPFVAVKPRPGQPYAMAAAASMKGDHRVAAAAFYQMLRTHLGSS